ncbi:MAG TPA: 50S ribosomal protein L11 methyltransferase [Gemmatimonadaceae bacterium]
MTWVEVRVRCAPLTHRDSIVAALVDAGAAGVQELDDELLTHLPTDADLDGVSAAVRASGSGTTLQCTQVGEIDSISRWPIRVGVQHVGRIAVAPPWLAHEIAGADIAIEIEPAMAFGTGEHETTRGVLCLMQDVVRYGDVVADLGAGSAVLSIAAAKLGAARVAAIELDPVAIGNAEENVERNGVGSVVTVIEGDAAIILPLLAPVRVILANILSSVVLGLADVIRDSLAPGGHAIISGILEIERDAVLAIFEAAGWRLATELTEGEWWSGVIERR